MYKHIVTSPSYFSLFLPLPLPISLLLLPSSPTFNYTNKASCVCYLIIFNIKNILLKWSIMYSNTECLIFLDFLFVSQINEKPSRTLSTMCWKSYEQLWSENVKDPFIGFKLAGHVGMNFPIVSLCHSWSQVLSWMWMTSPFSVLRAHQPHSSLGAACGTVCDGSVSGPGLASASIGLLSWLVQSSLTCLDGQSPSPSQYLH